LSALTPDLAHPPGTSPVRRKMYGDARPRLACGPGYRCSHSAQLLGGTGEGNVRIRGQSNQNDEQGASAR
jgi:hypothetical protein